MTFDEVMTLLAENGSEQTKKVLVKHGVREPFFGAKYVFINKLAAKIKQNQALALQLYATDNTDAMYLAGLIANPQQFDQAMLQDWGDKAYWYMLSEHCVSHVLAESPFADTLTYTWMQKSAPENLASAAWASLSHRLTKNIRTEHFTDEKVNELLDDIAQNIHQAPNRVRYTMNGFLIAAGGMLPQFYDKARSIAQQIGKVKVNMGETACKVPDAFAYIEKVAARSK
ncbi:MAG: DNA alkylation repair protein [Chitinophagales bacterium]|nr:DNA alkylation repair protein [Bacteroidota bacterium]MCB9043156.1 DNA alkylation repair protein [Chitinophagales bacterium]